MLAPFCAALVLSISATADVSPTLVDRVVDESNAIWKSAGVTLLAQRLAVDALTVVIGPQQADPDRQDGAQSKAPLGWIQFNDGRPQPRVYLSVSNAVALLEATRGGAGGVSRMPRLERDTLVGRALGRALAHELGHYLLASTHHTPHGLMKANFTAAEFFATDTRQFLLDGAERAAAVTRLDRLASVAPLARPSEATSGSSSPTSPRPGSPPPATGRWQGPIPY